MNSVFASSYFAGEREGQGADAPRQSPDRCGQDGLARIGVAVVALLAEGVFRACDLAPKSKKERKRLLGFPISQDGPIRQQIYWRALKTIPNFSIIEGTFLTNKKHLPIAAADRYPIRAKLGQWLMRDLKYNRDGFLLARVLKTEEKGSDVNLAAHLINDAHFNRFDEAIVVSGDSDLCDALRIVTQQIGKPIRVVNPQFRVSRELKAIASLYRHVHRSELRRNQFPNVLTDARGMFNKPHEWR